MLVLALLFLLALGLLWLVLLIFHTLLLLISESPPASQPSRLLEGIWLGVSLTKNSTQQQKHSPEDLNER